MATKIPVVKYDPRKAGVDLSKYLPARLKEAAKKKQSKK